ncbi:MAG TPA: hypothetical protein VF314_10885 [Actinomycetes bacterium]
MIKAKQGYWDVNTCAWVGADPAHDVPTSRHADPHDADAPVPEQRAAIGETAASATEPQ